MSEPWPSSLIHHLSMLTNVCSLPIHSGDLSRWPAPVSPFISLTWSSESHFSVWGFMTSSFSFSWTFPQAISNQGQLHLLFTACSLNVIIPGLWQLYVMSEQRESGATRDSLAISVVPFRHDMSSLITSAFSAMDSQPSSPQELGPSEFLYFSELALHLHSVKTEPEATENLNCALFF